MALFKPFRGSRTTLDAQALHDGYAYFCTDDGSFHIDYVDDNGILQRKQVNAREAEMLSGMSLEQILASSQADWSVNDETSPAYVKNRTHWVETEYITFIDNETVEFSSIDGGYVGEYANEDIVLINSNTYTFVIDGTSYNCTAHIFEYDGSTYIGNLSLLDSSFENTLEPFCIFCYNKSEISTMGLTQAGLMIATTLEGDSHVISLSGFDIVYHKIDKNYLPHLVGQAGSEEGAEIFNNYNLNTASGGYAHAEGSNTTAEGWYSHAEGNSTSAIGTNAHAEGSGSYAEGVNSHAEGSGTTASGHTSHAEGYNVVAASEYQHVQGKFNIEDANDIYAHIVGNGTNINSRSNAHTLDWDGNAWFQGAVKIGGTGQDDEAAKEVATKEYVDNAEFVSYNPQTLTDEQKAQVRANIDRYVWHTFSDSYGTYTYTLDPTKNFNYELAQTVANTSNNGSISALEDIVSWLSLLARCSYATPGAYNEVIENVAKNFDAIKNSGAGMSLSFYYQHTGHNGVGASVDVGLHPGDGYVVVTIYNGYADFHASFSYNSETNTTTEKYLNRRFADKTLSKEGYYADAKAVGDALALKADNLDDDDAIELATEMGLVSPTAAEDGSIYTDENGAIYTL